MYNWFSITNSSGMKPEKAMKDLLPQQVNHPNIIKVLHHWTETPPIGFSYPDKQPIRQNSSGVIFIEMEYADLRSLSVWFYADWRNPNYAKIFFYQITCGLSHLHEKGIIHRDLKPDNILLCGNTSTNRVLAKIGDFGISTHFRTTMTRGIGTCGYIAPEVVSQISNQINKYVSKLKTCWPTFYTY